MMPDQSPRIISSVQTFSYKIIIPVLWIVLFGFGTVGLWLHALSSYGQLPPEAIRYVFLLVWIVGSAVMLSTCAGLKKVQLAGDILIISNYQRDIHVPVTNIAAIREIIWVNPPRVTLVLRQPTAFGNEITFMPTRRLAFWRSHPIVAELKQRAGL